LEIPKIDVLEIECSKQIQEAFMPRPPRELARTSRRPRALGWAQPERKYNQSHRAEISERRISLILVCRGDMMDHRGYIMSHRGYIMGYRGYIVGLCVCVWYGGGVGGGRWGWGGLGWWGWWWGWRGVGGWLGWWGVAIMIEAQAKAKHCKPKWHD
jgi:hypothetical protein